MRYPPRILVVCALFASLALGWLSAVWAAGSPAEANDQPDKSAANQLVNPSFEEGDDWARPGFGVSGLLAPGWNAWFLAGPGKVAPEYFPEWIWKPSPMIHRGDFSQSMFNSYNTHDAGVWQTVDGFTPGQLVEFKVWARIWSSDCNDPCLSPTAPCRNDSNNTNGNYDIAVGIDPTGATPAANGQFPVSVVPPASVTWAWQRDPRYDEFVPLTIRTRVQGTKVTVYTRGTAEWSVQNNFSYWDVAELRVVTDEGTTPVATATGYATVTPTRFTPTPTHTATATATPPPTNTPFPTVTPGPRVPRGFLPYIALAGLPQPTPTATATATSDPSPTAPATPTGTATTAATPVTAQLTCSDVVTNGGFEVEDGWQMELTVPYPPSVDSSLAQRGSRSLRLGPAQAASQESWSYAWQAVTLPAGAERITLRYWLHIAGDDPNDEVNVELYSAQGVRVRRLLRALPTSSDWREYTVDLSGYAGSTVQLWFNAYNDGAAGSLTVHVDEVSVEVCQREEKRQVNPATKPLLPIVAPQAPTRKTTVGPNVHFTHVVYSPEQIGRSRVCPECRTEWALIVNDGDPVDLAGWVVTTNRGDRFVFPSLVLNRTEAVRLHSDAGPLTRTVAAYRQVGGTVLWDVYWGSDVGLLGNAHDNQTGRLTLTDPQGRQPAASICWGPTQYVAGSCN